MARKKGRGLGSRALQAESRKTSPGAFAALELRKRYPIEKLKEIIRLAAEEPNYLSIWEKSGVARDTVRYWLLLSDKGHPGDPFDVPMEDGRIERFHKAFTTAWADGADSVMREAWNLAHGNAKQQLSFQGHITYKIDPVVAKDSIDLDDLDWTLQYGDRKRSDIFMRDADGNFIPEVIGQRDPEMVRFLLKHLRKETFGNVMKVEHEHKGGVLVVGAQMTPKQVEEQFGGESKIEDVEFEVIAPPAIEGDK